MQYDRLYCHQYPTYISLKKYYSAIHISKLKRVQLQHMSSAIQIDNDVKREEVAGLIRELMEGEKGKQMRKKAVEWKESAVRATQPGGSSFLDLERLIKEVLLGRGL